MKSRKFKRRRRGGCALLFLLLIGGGLFLLLSNRSAETNTIVRSAEQAASSIYMTGSNLRQIFRNDLEVTSRTPIEGDAIVYSGDVKVREGGVIQGNLIVFSGDIEIDHGGRVHGDVTAFSGDIDLKGAVQGNLSAASGDVKLEDTAKVDGDVSVISGQIDREDGAEILGNIVNGSNIQLPKLPPLPAVPNLPAIPDVNTGIDGNGQSTINTQPTTPTNTTPTSTTPTSTTSSWLGWFGRLVLGILGATLAVAIATAAVVGVTRWRPGYIAQVEETMQSQLPLSFAFGFIANLPLIGLIALLRLVFCLAPLATLLLIGFLVINVPGWAAVSRVVGKRLASSAGLSIQPLVVTALGALVLAIPIALFWMGGGCLSFVGFILLLLVSSAGGGAVLMPWVRKLSNAQSHMQPNLATQSDWEPDDVVISTAEAVSEPEPPSPSQSAERQNVADLFAELDAMRQAKGEDEGKAEAEGVVATVGGDIENIDNAATDDFTRIEGIGRIFDRRLKDAGIKTYAQLAALTAEQVSAIIGWSPARVERDDLLGQARRLANE
ncbi:MAG: polymer-forming cytoskeletal protein [Caldilineaceae bacterium]